MGLVPSFRFEPAKGGLGKGQAAGGAKKDRRAAFFRGHLPVSAQASQMAQITHGDGAHSLLLGFFYGQFGREFGHDLAEAPMAVDLSRGRGLADDLRFGRRKEQSIFDLLEILDDANKPVGIVARQIVVGQMLRHDPAVFLRRPGGAEEMKGNFFQLFTRYLGHETSFIVCFGPGGFP